PEPTSTLEGLFSFDRVLYDAPTNGAIWARGRTYKASFAPTGATYIPFLGSNAPRNFPLTFRLVSAQIGDRSIPLSDAPSVRRTGDRIVIDHGPVLEVYDLAPESMEQSFHLSHRNATGELVLRLEVASELTGSPAGRTLRFDGPSGGVGYGEAFAFDESGQTANVESILSGSTLELRVPDAFEQEGTLVVDPVLTTLGTIGGNSRARRADVAYNNETSGGQAYAVFEYDFSSTDTDVFGIDIDDDGTTSGFHAVDMSNEIWLDPRVACLNGSNSFMVVSEVHLAAGANGLIQGRLRQGAGTTLSSPITINANPGLFDCVHPDIGADSRPVAGGRLMVVWESRSAGGDGDIHCRQYFATGQPATTVLSVSSVAGSDEKNPAISDSAGEPLTGIQAFNIVWEQERTPTNHDIYGAQITADGFLAAGRFPIDTTARDTTQPSVSSRAPFQMAGGDRYYAVSYVAENTVGSDVWVALLNGSGVERRRNFTLLEYDRLFSSHTDPEVVCTKNDFVMSYAATADGSSIGDHDVLMATFGLVDTPAGVDMALAERGQVIAESANLERRPALISRWDSGDFDSNGAFLVYDTRPALGTAFSRVGAALVRGWNFPRPIGAQYCSAEWNGAGRRGWLAAYGNQDRTTTKVLIASNLPVDAFGYLIVSLDRGLAPMAGGSRGTLCLSGAIGRYSAVPNQANFQGQLFTFVDPQEIPQPAGATSALFGQAWNFQCWHRDSFAGQPTSNFTNAVTITFL
ncbi:MAG: hypothetical protein AAGG01_17750, partial [Planctomycetota bacterium]